MKHLRTDPRRAALILIAASLLGLFWGLAWRQMNDSILTRVPILDEAHYLRAARALADGGWRTSQPYYMSPLYTWLVALTGSGRELDASGLLVGTAPWGLRILQTLLWLGVALMLGRLGRRLFGRRWGWLPPLLWCFYLPAAVLASQVLLEVPLTFCATAALMFAGGWLGPVSTVRRALLAGACVGAATLLRGTSLALLAPVIFTFFLPESRIARPSRLRGITAVLAAALLVILPAVIHNSVTTGGLRGPSLNGGVNLYIGNWSGANGFFFAFSGFDVERDPGGVKYLTAETGDKIDGLAAADARWASLARGEMIAHPGRTLGLWARKVWLHLVGIEIPQISPLAAWTRLVTVFRILLVPYALLMAGALGGVLLGWRRRPELWPWIIAAIVLIAAQSVFFVTTRYRLILVPVLALLTTSFLRELAGRRGRELLAGIGAAVAVVLVILPWGLGHTRELFALSGLDNEATRWYHVAEADSTLGERAAQRAWARAEKLQLRSLAADSSRSQPWQGLARLSWLHEDRSGAMNLLKEGLALVPEGGEMKNLLIRMQLEDGRSAEAIPYLDSALKDKPNDLTLLHLMVAASVGASRRRSERDAVATLKMGESAARRAVSLAPDRPEGLFDLGLILANLGGYREALGVLARGLDLTPVGTAMHGELDDLRKRILSREKAALGSAGNPAQE